MTIAYYKGKQIIKAKQGYRVKGANKAFASLNAATAAIDLKEGTWS